jgi:hypothetical protein
MPVRFAGEDHFRDRFRPETAANQAERRAQNAELAAYVFASDDQLKQAGLVREPDADQQRQAVLSDGAVEKATHHLKPAWARRSNRPPSETMQEQAKAEAASEAASLTAEEKDAKAAEWWRSQSPATREHLAAGLAQLEQEQYAAESEEWETEARADLDNMLGDETGVEYVNDQAELSEQAELEYYQSFDPANEAEGSDWSDEDLSIDDTEEVTEDGSID